MTKLLIAFAAITLFAADAPKPADLPPLPVEQKLAIREAQLTVARLSDALGKLALQYQSLEKQHTEAQAALTKLVGSIPKPKDCADCALGESMVWQRPGVEQAKK